MKQKKKIVVSKAANIDDLLDEVEYLDNLMFDREDLQEKTFNVYI